MLVLDHEAPVEVNVFVVAIRPLVHFELDAGQLAQVLVQIGELFQIQSAGVQVGLEPLEVLAALDHVVAPQQAPPASGREDAQGPLEHRLARALRPHELHLVDVDLVLAVRNRLEFPIFDLGLDVVVFEVGQIDV